MNKAMQFWDSRFQAIDGKTFDFSKRPPASFLGAFCEQYLNTADKVLDLGCGGGRNAQALAERGLQVYGIDFAPAAVELCRTRFDRFQLSGSFQQGTFDQINFPDRFFSAVVCIAAFDHVPMDEAQAALKEIRRVLVPGGPILLTFDPPDTDEELLDEAEVLPDGTLSFVSGGQAGMLFRRYQDAEIRELIGEVHILSFTHDSDGARIIICN